MNIKSLLITALTATVAVASVPVLARHDVQREAAQIIKLKDGATLYVFTDGKMAKEDRLGRAVHLQDGESLQSVDGRQLRAVGNEVARLEMLLNGGHRQ